MRPGASRARSRGRASALALALALAAQAVTHAARADDRAETGPSAGTESPPPSASTSSAEEAPPPGTTASQVRYDGPDHAAARELVRQGRDYAARGEDSAAMRRFTEALTLDPAYGPAYVELGAARERSGDYPEAQRVYERGIAYAPRFAGTYLARGALRDRLGDQTQAILDFETASRLGGAVDLSAPEAEARDLARRDWPAALARSRRWMALAASSRDPRQEHNASVQAAALSILCGEVDPVRAGARGRGWVRAAMASAARRRGVSASAGSAR